MKTHKAILTKNWFRHVHLRITGLFILIGLVCSPVHGQDVRLNEVVSENDGFVLDEDGDDSDWIELFNSSSAPISLMDYFISDDSNDLFKWSFPNYTMQAGEHLIVFCSGKDRGDIPLHTNFKIKSTGESIILVNGQGEIVSQSPPTPLTEGFSLARLCLDECYWERLSRPSPAEENDTYSVVSFSAPSGSYIDDLELTMSHSLGHEIRYTVDGSIPDLSSPIFEETLQLSDPTGTVAEISSISTSPNWTAPSGDIQQINVVRARSFNLGQPTSDLFSKTYAIGTEIRETFEEYPVVSILTSPSSLFNVDTGLFVPGVHFSASNSVWTGNYFQRGEEWERDAQIEFFEGDQLMWSQGAGIRTSGGKTRNAPQKSIRVYAREHYGASKFHHEFFDTKDKTVFDKFLLRAHFGCWNRTAIRDGVSSYLAHDLDLESQHSRPCVVFINGEYWGLYLIRDYLDSNFIEEEFDIEKDSVSIILNGSGNRPGFDESWGIVEGDNVHYLETLDFMENNDMSLPESFDYLSQRFDMSSMVDYYCTHIYFAKQDWPSNNHKMWRDAESGWRWMLYDFDSAWGYLGASHNTMIYAAHPTGSSIYNTPYATYQFRKMLESPQFVSAFLNRMACLMNNEFSADRVELALDRFVDLYTPGMPDNIDRWHNVTSMADWNSKVNSKMYSFNTSRRQNAIGHIESYFGIDFNPDDYECHPFCQGDFNADGQVNIDDFVTFNNVYGNPCTDCLEDLNGNGLVEIDDFLQFNSIFGTVCW